MKPPKYFDRILEKENPELYKKIKAKRQLIAERRAPPKTKLDTWEYDAVRQNEAKISNQKIREIKKNS